MTDHQPIMGERLAATLTDLEKVNLYFGHLPVAVAVFIGPEQVIDFVNAAYCQLIGRPASEIMGQPLLAVFPELAGSNIDTIHQRVMHTGIAEQIDENPVSYLVNGVPYHGYFNTRFHPLKDGLGNVMGLLVAGYDVTETVTEKKRKEQKELLLQKAKEQMELGINTGKVGLWYWDAATDTLTWSTEQLQLFGLEDHSSINRVSDFHRFVLPEDLLRMYENSEQEAGALTDYAYKFRIRRTDGALRWLQARSRTSFDASGKLMYITGINIDITEQEEFRQQLEASERRFRSLAENSPDVISRHGRDFKYLYISPRIESYTGHKPEFFIGRTYYEVGLPEYLCRFFDDALTYVFDTGKPHQVSYKMPGDNRHVFSRLTPELNEAGEIESVLIISTDVTEQKGVEELLKAKEEHLTLALEGGELGTYDLNPQNGQVVWSDRTRALFGVDSTTPITLGLFYNAIHPGDRERVGAAANKAMQPGDKGDFDEEYRVINLKDGQLRWIRSRGRVFFDDQRQPLRFIGVVQEITRYKEILAQLQEGRERLQAALNASHTGTFRWNIRTNDLSWDENLDRLFGMQPGESVQHLDDFLARVHPQDRERVAAACAACARGSGDFDETFRVVWSDGSVRWLDDKGKTFTGADGRPSILTGACMDITDRKKNEEALTANEERFRTLGNSIAQLAWMADETGYIYWYNDRWYAYTGLDFKTMEGWGWQEVHHPDHIGRVVRFVAEAWTKDEPWELTFPLRRSDGVYRWFLTRAYPIKDAAGKVTQWIGTNTDIHEQLETQQALRQSEAELRVLADFQPQIVWTAGKLGLLDYVNKRWEEFTGSPSTSAYGDGWHHFIHPEDRDGALDSWHLSVSTGAYYEIESRIRRHDGVYRWYLNRGQALRDDTGQIIKWFGTSTDIHDRKTMSVQLEALVKERTRALQRSNEDLQQFAHVASHDLKEPVRKMKTFSSLLELELGDKLSAKARVYFEKMDSATNRMLSMINGVLSYSTFNAVEETFQPVDLNEVLEQISTDLELAIQEKGAVLQFSGLPTVPGVPLLLYQLFYNLINNSLKFTRSGVGPRIHIETAPATLNGAPAVAITLTDNGIGFKQEYASQIFNTFTRLHSKDKYEGNGLGLALCKKIAERHGGIISAGGAENQGAVFTVVLPV